MSDHPTATRIQPRQLDVSLGEGAPDRWAQVWAVVVANPWLLLGAIALLLTFLYAMARLVLSNRRPGEDAGMRLLWFFKFEVRGRDASPSRLANDQLHRPGSEHPGRSDIEHSD
jgi:hypothetical protein